MKILHIYSGGLDSTVLLAHLISQGHVLWCVNFYYASKHNTSERAAASAITGYLGLPIKYIDLDFMGAYFKSDLLATGGAIPEGHYEDENMKKTVVPFRNGIMLSIAAGLAESEGLDAISLGAHAGDHAIYPDCRATFLQYMRDSIYNGTWAGIKLLTPFENMSKADIVKIGATIKAPMEMTWTCYKGRELHCGKCGACTERKEAFKINNIPDPTKYEE